MPPGDQFQHQARGAGVTGDHELPVLVEGPHDERGNALFTARVDFDVPGPPNPLSHPADDGPKTARDVGTCFREFAGVFALRMDSLYLPAGRDRLGWRTCCGLRYRGQCTGKRSRARRPHVYGERMLGKWIWLKLGDGLSGLREREEDAATNDVGDEEVLAKFVRAIRAFIAGADAE